MGCKHSSVQDPIPYELSKEELIPRILINLLEKIHLHSRGGMKDIFPEDLFKKVENMEDRKEFVITCLYYIFRNSLYVETVDGMIIGVSSDSVAHVSRLDIHNFVVKKKINQHSYVGIKYEISPEEISLEEEVENFNSFVTYIWNKLIENRNIDQHHKFFLPVDSYKISPKFKGIIITFLGPKN